MRRLAFAAVILMSGCATPARQTQAVLKSPLHIPTYFQIKNMPFVAQTEGYCGPATLSMAMRWAGSHITLEDLGPQVMTPGKKGTLQVDMISAGRRQGLMAIPLEGLPALLTEVASGHPVIVFENLGFSWYPQWHYAIVFGYDLETQEVIMHSGADAFKHWDMSRFERSWMLGDYWGLVLLPAGELSAAADELAHMRAAAGLEQAGKIREAGLAYHRILEQWPKSLGALIGLGNLAFKRNDFHGAVGFLKMAAEFYPDSIMARHNLTVASAAAAALRPVER